MASKKCDWIPYKKVLSVMILLYVGLHRRQFTEGRTALEQITKVWWYSVENGKNVSALFYLASDVEFSAFWWEEN